MSFDINAYHDQTRNLQTFKNYVSHPDFDADSINMLKRILPKTKLNSMFVYNCLKNYHELSISTIYLENSKISLHKRVTKLKKDLSDYLTKRIYLLNHLREIKPNTTVLLTTDENQRIGSDPWILNTVKKLPNEEQFVAASLHIRDILFASREVSLIIPEKSQEFLKELKEFNTIHLPKYCDLLSNLNNEEKKQITQVFQKLQTLMEKNKFEEVPSQLSIIRKLLRHSGIPPSNDASLSTDTNEAS